MKSEITRLSEMDALTGDDARACQLFEAGRGVARLSEIELARLGRRLSDKRVRARRPTWILLAAAGVFFISAASAGYLFLVPKPSTLDPSAPPPPAGSSQAEEGTNVASKPALPGSEEKAAGKEVETTPEPVQDDTTAGGMRPKQSDVGSGLEREAALMGEVLATLRKQGNASKALVLLDAYEREFPAGALKSEALVARAEALDRLGKSGDALRLLDGASLSTPHLLVLRGNLRAKLNRCESAIKDYDQALRVANPEALIGRADCRLRLGQKDAARRDYESYLRLYPEGRSVAKAKAALGIAPRELATDWGDRR